MRIKTQAILITEDTYPIAVACLPAGFSAYPFENIKGYWLVINVPGAMEPGEYMNSVLTFHNEWVHPKTFVDAYAIINKKPGRKPENPDWVEVERAQDEDLKQRLNAEAEDTFQGETIIRTNPLYGGTRAKRRQPLVGYHRS